MNPELAALQDVIQDLHELMAVLRDPNDTAIVAQCMKALTGIQKDMMVNRPQNARQALVSQLGLGGNPNGQ